MTRPVAVALVVALLVASAPPAKGGDDETTSVATRRGAPLAAERVDAAVRWGPVSTRGAGWGFVRVDLANRDREPRVVELEVRGDPYDHDAHVATRAVRIEAGGRVRTWLPVLPSSGSPSLKLDVRGGRAATVHRTGVGHFPALLVADGPRAATALPPLLSALNAALAAAPGSPAGRTPSVGVVGVDVEAADLPPTFAWMSAASFVLVDATARGLEDAERQRTLARHAHAGGTVIVLGAGALPKGPLADVAAEALAGDVGAVAHGLGTVVAVAADAWTPATVAKARDLSLRRATDAGERFAERHPPVRWSDGTSLIAVGDAVPGAFGVPLAIPGVGRPPVLVFFVLLVVFALLAGPVTYLLLRRRRRLTLLLAVVPALGLLFAAGILGWGVLSEGLGTKGTVRSFTVLDQRTHEAATVAARTVFTSFGPDALSVSPDTAVVGDLGTQTYWGERVAPISRLRFDADGARLDGRALPSRTLTPFATTTQGRARERLRFRRETDGRYACVGAEGFEPRPGEGRLVLRAPDGSWHVGGGGAPLEPVAEGKARAALVALAEDAGRVAAITEDERLEPASGRRMIRSWGIGGGAGPGAGAGTPEALAVWFLQRASDGLAPGSYLASTTRAPRFDELGLEVRWIDAVHLVHGLLAAEDVDG